MASAGRSDSKGAGSHGKYAEASSTRAALLGGGYEAIRWRAPEINDGIETISSEATAVYSVGMLLWELLTAEIPFGEIDAITASRKTSKGHRPSIQDMEGSPFAGIISRCWAKEAEV